MSQHSEKLVPCDSADGWSLHAPGSTDEAIASGDAPALASGEWQGDDRTIPASGYADAHRTLRALVADSEEPRWWAFRGYNLQAVYAWGTEAQASAFQDHLNAGRSVDHYALNPVSDPDAEQLGLADRTDAVNLGEDGA